MGAVRFHPLEPGVIASGGDDGRVRFWRMASDGSDQMQIATMREHTAPVCGLAFTLDGTTLASSSVDTTVQPKNITFPTDAKLLLVAIQQLGKLAKEHDVELRQSYARVAKRAAIKVGRYAHAKQFKRMNREIKFLRTRLGRVIRDIQRKTKGDEEIGRAHV